MIYKLTLTFSFLNIILSNELITNDNNILITKWNLFKINYNKNYLNKEEEDKRYQIFINNLDIINKRNKEEISKGGNAIHGITKFSDISQNEFELNYLLSKSIYKNKNNDNNNNNKNQTILKDIPKYNGPAGLVDWSGTFTTPVKDQGYCGSCWAFSATAQIESDAIRTLGAYFILSPEQITQCDSTSYGCGGGWTEHAYDYVRNAGGIQTDGDYPYTSYWGETGSCHADSSRFVIGVDGYSTIWGESNMASYVQSTGPLSVCVDASNWNSYTGGIMYSCGQSVDHCVQAVGVDTDGGYWKVRNSWGTSWGEGGYIRLSYGSNTCAIASDPTFVNVRRI